MKSPPRRLVGVGFVAALALLQLLLPHAPWLIVTAWLLACFAPGVLLVRRLLGAPRGAAESVEQTIFALAAGYGFTLVVMLVLAQLPGGLLRWQLVLIFAVLDMLLLLPRPAPRSTAILETPTGRPFWAGLALVLLVGAVLRLTHLGYSEFQGDEARVMLRAGDILLGFENTLWVHNKAPGEMLISAALYGLSGESAEWAARLPFTLAGLGSLAGIYCLGRRLLGAAAGLTAGLLLAVDGYLVAFARIVQYQSVVILSGVALILLLWRAVEERDRLARRLLLAGILGAGGVLYHTDMLAVTLPALLLIGLLLFDGVPLRRLLAALAPALLLSGGLVALFAVPFLRYPGFSSAYRYVVSERLGMHFPYNNVADFVQRTMLYSSSYYVILLFGVALIYLAALVARRWGWVAGSVAGLGTAVLAAIATVAPGWVTVGTADLSGLLLALPLFGMILLPGLRRAERLVWLWFGPMLIGALFLISLPDSHVYIFMVPLALVVGAGVQRLWDRTARRTLARPLLVAAGTTLLLVLAGYPWLLFADAPAERLRQWETKQPAAYWYPYAAPPERAIFAFPLRNGWKRVGVAYATGEIEGSFETNARPEVADWYTRGAGGCPAAQQFFFLTQTVEPNDDERLAKLRAEVEGEYRWVGGAPDGADAADGRMRIYARTPDALRGETLLPWEPVNPVTDFEAQTALPMQSRRGRVLAGAPEVAKDLLFGDSIRLTGFDPGSDTVAPGESTSLTLYWEMVRPTYASYTIFIHVVEPATNSKAGQTDALPVCGQNLTNLWNPGDLVRDTQRVEIWPEAAPGTYHLYVGLYDVLTGARLPVSDGAGAALGDFVDLAPLVVK